MFLVILSGMPCSGKTQLATILAKDLEINHRLPTVVVDPDKIREMIPALRERFNPEREFFVNSLALRIIEESLRQKNIVVSDDMNYYESSRHRLVQLAKKHKMKYIIIHLTVSVEIAEKRNAARASPIPQGIISEISQNFDYPGSKYKWDLPSLVIDSEKTSPEDAARRVLQVLLSQMKARPRKTTESIYRVEEKSSQKIAQHRSFKEILENYTRRILNELFSSGALDKRLSTSANRIRREFVDEASKRSMTIEDAGNEFRKRVKEAFP
jgi:tRNA uridine 5-carbamoylmethylation protein Kti12